MNSNINDILKSKNIFCFGAGAMGKDFADFLLDCNYDLSKVHFIDNDKKKQNTTKAVGGYNVQIKSKEWMTKNITTDDCIVIATLACHEIYEDISRIEALKNIKIYFSQLVFKSLLKPTKELKLNPKTKQSIPKIIHYCWFGGKDIPDKWKRYIAGWQEKCPDYEIKRWDESNYDITKNLYMKQAYEAKRWGFVPDYARLDIVYNYGGIYLDTDVELLKPLDCLLGQSSFFGISPSLKVNAGCGFGATVNNSLIKEMRDYYDNVKFMESDGTINAVPCTEYQHAILHKHGFKLNGEMQLLKNTTILPFDILGAYNHYFNTYSTSENTIAVHHSERTWHDDKMRERTNQSVRFLNT